MNTSHHRPSFTPNILPPPPSARLRAVILFAPLHCTRCMLDSLILSDVAAGGWFLVSGAGGGVVAGSLGVVTGSLVRCV